MAKYTRRSFVKRSGSATLSAALGLGLLPSLTRKLHAADSSNLTGIKANAPQGLNVTTTKTLESGGTLELELNQVLSAPAGLCVLSIRVTQTYRVKLKKTLNGVTYRADANWVREYTWKCENGNPAKSVNYDTTPSAAIGSQPTGLAIQISTNADNTQSLSIFCDGKDNSVAWPGQVTCECCPFLSI